jgi:hypothetical protein
MHLLEFYTMLMDCLLGALMVTWILLWLSCKSKHSHDQVSSYRALLERLESTYTKDAGIESRKNVLYEGKI